MTPEAIELEEAVISNVAKAMPHAALMACSPDDLAAIARAALAVVREKMRADALEEAAKVADRIDDECGMEAGLAKAVADAIRALIAASPLGGGKP